MKKQCNLIGNTPHKYFTPHPSPPLIGEGRKEGFTLVELSIVLVIIGLLVGGILVGQSLIQSAEINKEVRRLSQYAIAVVQFQRKFKQEVGDTILFSNPGNNDGDTIDHIGACPTTTSERYSAWSHLSESGMLTGETFVWTANPTPTCSSNFVGATPTNKITANGSILPYYYSHSRSGSNYDGKIYQRYFYIVYDPEIIWGLENKLDDGVPSQITGRISSNTAIDYNDCTETGINQEIFNYGVEYGYCEAQIYFNDSLN